MFSDGYNSSTILQNKGLIRIEQGLSSGEVDAIDEFRSFFVDMYLLAEGDGFVGGFTSRAARLSYSLMSAGSRGCLKPYISTDINWCLAYARGSFGPEGVGVRYGNISLHDAPGKSPSHP